MTTRCWNEEINWDLLVAVAAEVVGVVLGVLGALLSVAAVRVFCSFDEY